MNYPHNERGSGSVMGLLLVVVALLAAGCIMVFIAASHAALQAGTAADLAALAAADTARGLRQGSPCAVAEALSTANGAILETCAIEGPGDTVRLRVSVPVHFGFAGLTIYQATAVARAGPPSLI